jgi:hypothetical protein
MSQQTTSEGLVELQEIVLFRGTYAMSVPANTQQQLESRAHNLKLTPFYDYKISNDGGTTFWPPSQFQTLSGGLIYVDMFVDNTTLYFSYHYSSGAPANAALSLLFQFKLFVTEATK